MSMDERAMHGVRRVAGPLALIALAGCGGGGGGGTPAVDASAAPGGTSTAGQGGGADPLPVSSTGGSGGSTGISDPGDGGTGSGDGDPLDPLVLLGDDTALLSRIPEVVETVTLADSGLRVAYTNLAQQQQVEPAYLEAQWAWMQACTGVTAMPPLVVVIEGAVRPFVATDDVIRDITGLAQAATSITAAGSVVQVSDVDFDDAPGGRGFLIRAMLGRMLWIGDGLAERDYPFECARNDPGAPAEATDALSRAGPAR